METDLILKLQKQINQLKNRLAEEKKFLSSLLDIQSSLVVVLDTTGRIIKFNQACENITGYSLEEVKGELIWEKLIPEDEKEETKRVFQDLKKNDLPNEHKNHWQDKDGELHLISWSNTVITNDKGKIKYIVATGIDITKSKEQEDRINYLSFHDSLTDLYNRAYLEEEMKRLNTPRQLPISLIMGDANGLKLINDTYGHSVGDKMLIKIAEILTDSCRQEDIIARWGGDEFVVLLPQTKVKTAQSISERIKENCAEDSIKNISLSMALGAAAKKVLNEDLTKTLKRAEERMYKNKLIQSKNRHKEVLSNILSDLKEETDESKCHIKNVEKVSLALGAKIGLSASELNKLSLLAIVHDIGKITIAKKLFNKESKLNEDERKKINKHPEKGHQIVSTSQDLSPVANSLLYHHENWDGSGYPLGLTKNDIPLQARIIHLAIAYDVMANGRSYKEAMPKEDIITELKDKSGTQFDPSLTTTLIHMIKNDDIKYPVNQFSRSSSVINDFLN